MNAIPTPPQDAVQAPTPAMDLDFIERNQIVERYLTGKLPPRGAQDFELFCRQNPELLDRLRLSERINAALRLLDASGRPEPWAEKSTRFYQKPLAFAIAAAAAGSLAIAAILLAVGSGESAKRIEQLQREVTERPLAPATSTRPIVLVPSRNGPGRSSVVTIGGNGAELADFKIDVSWSKSTTFKVIIDRVDQGRVAVLGNVLRDSNGQLRIALNSTALGPGDYQLTLEGLNWRGEPTPEAWVTISVVR